MLLHHANETKLLEKARKEKKKVTIFRKEFLSFFVGPLMTH